MAITFNDEPLLLEVPLISKIVKRWWRWPLSVINTPLRPTSTQSYCRAPNWPRVPPLKPNQLYIPSGATRWSRVLLLTSQATAETFTDSAGILRFDALTPYPSRTVTATITPAVADNPETGEDESAPAVTLQWHLESSPKLRMHLLQPIPLSDHGEDIPPPVVLPMVDDRYFWQGKLTTTTAETWEDLLTDLIADLADGTGVGADEYIGFELQDDGGTWVVPLADPNVSVPDPCVFRNGPIATAAALDLACWTLGLRCVPKDLSTSDSYTRYQLVYWGERGTGYPKASEIYDEQLTALKAEWMNNSGSETPVTPDNTDIPESARMTFLGGYRLEMPVENAIGQPRDFWSTASAQMNGSFPLNGTDLSLLLELWVDEWQEQLSTAFHWSWNGTPNLRFSGYEDYILYSLALPPKGSTPLPITHQRSLPRNVGYEYIPFQLPEYVNRDCGVTTDGSPVTPTAGGCVCCDCMECIDLCDAPSVDVVSGCAGCPNGALKQYVVTVGNWLEYPNITAGGTIYLDHDADCEWRSEEVDQDGGTYQWVLSQAEGGPELYLEHISGADPLRITNGYWQVKWIPSTGGSAWSCLCNMNMKVEEPDKMPRPTEGLNCSVCVMPRVTAGNRVPITCSPVEGVQPCVEPFDFPTLAFTYGSGDPLEFPYGFEGDTGITFDMEWTIDVEIPCKAVGGGSVNTTSGLGGPAVVSAVLNYGAGTLTLRCSFPTGETYRVYSIDPETLVLGDNVFDVEPLGPGVVDDSAYVTWPATVTVTLSDCTFGSTHPDIGYGCGGSESETGCGGFGCTYAAIDSNGAQGGSVGPWTWGGCEGGCPDGCTMPGPPGEPPTSGGDTYSVLCEPSV